MTTFETLDHFLGQDYSDNFWSDEAVLDAEVRMQNLGREEWPKLRAAWAIRDERWQQRCADVLPRGDLPQALSVLIQMVRTAKRDVRVAALDSLRELDLDPCSTEEQRDIKLAIEESFKSADPVEATVLRALAKKLNLNLDSASH